MQKEEHPSLRGRQPTTASTWLVRVLYDGDCPLCAREIATLRRLDRGRGRIDFEDIAAPDFDASRYGVDPVELMARIHGVLPDGTRIEGVEVFRRLYGAVGFGWLVAPTRWPLLRPLFDAAYRAFARNRLRWTGREGDTGQRCTPETCAAPKDGSSTAA